MNSDDPYISLRNRDFRLILLTRLFIALAIQIQAITIGWLVYQKTGNPLALGYSGLAEALPYIFTSAFSGLIADSYNRQRVVGFATGLLLIASAVLFFHTLYDTGSQIMPYYIVLMIVGLARGFMGPSFQALWADILPRNQYANGATWSSNIFNAGAVSGPAIGGLLYGFFGANTANAIVCILILCAALCIARVQYTYIPVQHKQEKLGDKLMTGLRFVFSRQILIGAMALDMFAVLFGGAIALLPAFTKDILLAGPEALGILRAAPFTGSLLMGIWLAHHPPVHKTGLWLLGGVAGFGLCTIGFALSESYWLSFALLALSGSFDNISMVIRGSIAQLFTPDDMRGRVSAVNGVFIGASNEIGAFESGLAASLLGLVPSVIFGGSMTLLIVLITAVAAPVLRRFELSKTAS